jgi:hypothetical protein
LNQMHHPYNCIALFVACFLTVFTCVGILIYSSFLFPSNGYPRLIPHQSEERVVLQ